MTYLFIILVGQGIAIIVVMFVLKGVLDKTLIELAVRHIEVWKFAEAKGIDRILVVTHKPLKKDYVERVQKALAKNFSSQVTADFQVQKRLLGGAVIHVGEQILDCSLKDRLAQAFRM